MARGLWPPAGGGLCSLALRGQRPFGPRVVVSPSRAMSIKSALRDLLSVSYGLIGILVISRCAAPPYPAAPDFPPSGGQNKTPRDNLLINPPLEMTVLADTPPSFRPKRSGVEKSHSSMVKKAWRQEISRLRASWARFPSAPIAACGSEEKTDAASEAAL